MVGIRTIAVDLASLTACWQTTLRLRAAPRRTSDRVGRTLRRQRHLSHLIEIYPTLSRSCDAPHRNLRKLGDPSEGKLQTL